MWKVCSFDRCPSQLQRPEATNCLPTENSSLFPNASSRISAEYSRECEGDYREDCTTLPATPPTETEILALADSGDRGLLHAFIFDGKGGAQEIGWAELMEWTPDQGKIWVHLNYLAPNAAEWLMNHAKIEPIIAEALVARETRPRSITAKKGLVVNLRGVNLNAGNDPEDMISIRSWIDEDRIITLRKHTLRSVRELKRYLEEGQGSKNPGDLFCDLVYILLDRIGEVLGQIDEEMDDLEEAVLMASDHQPRRELLVIRQKTIALRRYLAPQREVLSRLPSEKSTALSDKDRMHLRENSDRMTRFLEDLDEVRERAAIAQDELSTRINERLSKNTYVLSVIAAIFLPLSLLTGLLGINVSGIPGEKDEYAFLFVCVMLVVTGILQFVLYRKLHWI